MSESLYPWLHAHWRQLAAYAEQQRIPQALIFSGRAELGQEALALAFAHSLLCFAPQTGKACGFCHACQLCDVGNHPDLLFLQPEEPSKLIGIDAVRRLVTRLALKPQYERQRVVIIQPADALNTAAANAFLKCLEEPTERTSFILLTRHANRLPATIRSRCQQMHFLSPEPDIAIQWLRQQGVKQAPERILAIAQGSPVLALQYAGQGMETLHMQMFNDWLNVIQHPAQVLEVAEQWQKQSQVDIEVILTWMASWLTDLIKLSHSAEQKHLRHPDLQVRLQALLKPLNFRAVYAHYDLINRSRQQLQTTLNKQLLLEKLLIEWSRINQGLTAW
jgi:DNA polymerase-3 subunit delta'